jgi:hypothetical protein
MAALLSAVLVGEAAAQDLATNQMSDCGNPPLICIPIHGLSIKDSVERKSLQQLYDVRVRAADNDRNKLFNDRLANALHNVLIGADDWKNVFWVIVINPTHQKQTSRFYVARARETFDDDVDEVHLNCPLDPSLCLPRKKSPFRNLFENDNPFLKEDDGSGAFDKVWGHLQNNWDEMLARFEHEIDADSTTAIAFSPGVPADADRPDAFSVALLGANAVNRIKLDRRDLLRIGIVRAAKPE